MGTSNSQWRAAVGHWSGDVSFHTDPCSSEWGQEQHTTAHWSPIGLLTSLLVIGGVELNPGPNSTQTGANERSSNIEDENSGFVEILHDEGVEQLDRKPTTHDLKWASGVTQTEGEPLICWNTDQESQSQTAEPEVQSIQVLKNKTIKRGKMLQDKKMEISELREKKRKLSRNLQEKETEVYRLASENEKLAKELEIRGTEAQRLRSENSAAETELRDKVTEICHLRDVHNLLDLEMQSRKKETAVISDGNRELGTLLQKKETDIQRVKEENRLLELKLQRIDAEFLSLTNKNTEIVGLLNSTKRGKLLRVHSGGELENIPGDNFDLKGNTSDSEGKLIYDNTVLTATIEDTEWEIQRLTEENSRLRQELHEKRKEEQRLRDENMRFDIALQEKEPQLETLTDENKLLRQAFKEKEMDIERLTEENMRYEKELEEKEQESENLANRNSQVNEDFREKRSQMDDLSDENTRLEKSMQEAMSEAERLEVEIARIEKELHGKESDTDRLKCENARLANLLRESETEAERLRGEHTHLDKELHEKKSQIALTTEQNVYLGKELQVRNEALTIFTEENERLRSELQEKKQATEQLTEENTRLSKELQEKEPEIERLAKENTHIRKALQEKVQEIEHLTEENKRLSKELHDKEADIMAITEENTHYCKVIQEKEHEIEILAEKSACHARILQEKVTEIECLTQENTCIRNILQENEAKGVSLTGENVRLDKQLQESELRIEGVTEENERLREKLKDNYFIIECLNADNSRLNNELQQKEKEIKHITEENADLWKELEEKSLEEEHLTEEVTRLRRGNEEKNLKIHNIKEDHSQLERNLQDSEAVMRKLTEENMILGQQLQHKKSDIECLTEENVRLETEVQENVRKTESITEENLRMREELEYKRSKIDLLTEERIWYATEVKQSADEIESLAEETKLQLMQLNVCKAEKRRMKERNVELRKEMQNEILETVQLTRENVIGKALQEKQAETGRLARDNLQLRSELLHMNQEKERLAKENELLSKELEGKLPEIARITDENKRLGKELQEKESMTEQLTEENSRLAKKLQSEITQMQTKSQREMNRNLEDQLHEKKVILENMEKEKAQLENKLINIEEEINIVAAKTRDLEMKLLSKEQTIKSLRESCDVYGDQIRAKVKEIQRLTERIGGLEKDMQVKETLSLKLKNENCDTGKYLQEKDPETKELTEENVKLMAMSLIKKRDRSEGEENELLGNVSETQTGKFNVQLMRKVKEFQGPRYENTDFGINLKMKVEESMELAEMKKTAEGGFLAKQCELQKFRDDNTGLIKRTDTWKGTTSFRAQNVDFYGGKQNEKTNVGTKGNDTDLGEEFRNESAVSEIDNCHTEARKMTELMNVKTGIKTDTRQTEIQNEIHADSDGVQHPATATGVKRPGDGRRGKGNFLQDRTDDSSDNDKELQVEDTTGLMQGETKRSSAHNGRTEETTFLKQLKPHSVGNLKRFPTLQRHVSLDTGFDSVTKKPNFMMRPDGISENRKLREQLSISRSERQSVVDGSKGRVVLMDMPLVTSRYKGQIPKAGPNTTECTSMQKPSRVYVNAELSTLNVAALVFTRAINAKLVFQLASHKHIPYLFNDIILKLGKQTLFLQLKECPCHNKYIDKSQIFQLKGDFSLLRHYKSFCETKKLWTQNKNLQNYGRFEDSIFVVYTNAVMSGDNGHSADYTVWQEVLCSRGKYFTFCEDKFPEVYEIFKNLERYKQLLADSTYNLQLTTNQQLLDFVRKVWNSKAAALPGIIELNKLLKELQELGDLSHYKEFLSRFWFLTEQGTEQQLEEQIKQQIGLACGTTETNLIYTRFKKEMGDWYRYSDQVLTQESQIWKDIRNGNDSSNMIKENKL